MCLEWIYECIDMDVSVEMNRGDVVQGVLVEIDRRMNLKLLSNGTYTLVPSTEINTIILPKHLLPLFSA